jgi:hypothetical protein
MNRLVGYLSEHSPRFSFEFTTERRRMNPQQAFVACPLALVPQANGGQLNWQDSIYRLAYEQAQAIVAAREQARESAYPWN